MLTITKEFTFDSGHMLYGHDGECKNIHGHTYKILVEITNEELIKEGPSKDMILDFSILKEVVKNSILKEYDHAFLFNNKCSYELEIAEFLHLRGHKIKAINGRTTCENLSKILFNDINRFLKVVSITLYETPTSFARYAE